jgi:toxin ParE1/3/4
MARYFRFVEAAEAELDEATTYYEAEASMGAAFAAEVERVLELALQFPQSGTLVPQRRVRRELRLFRLNPDFPYDIVATTIEEEDLLLVIAIAHHSRKPKYWRNRVGSLKGQ